MGDEVGVHPRTVLEPAALALVGHEGNRDIPGHLRVADEGLLLGGAHVDDLHLVRRGFPHLVGVRGGHIETERGSLALGKLAARSLGGRLSGRRPSGVGFRHRGTPFRALAHPMPQQPHPMHFSR